MRTKELQGNIRITVSQNEVRIWVCNKKGQNIFRFKAMGKIFEAEDGVVIMQDQKRRIL